MFLPSPYSACTCPRPTAASCLLDLLTRPSNEIHRGVPMMGTQDRSMHVRRFSYNVGTLEVVPMDCWTFQVY